MADPGWLFFLPDVPLEKLRSAGLAITPTNPGRWHAGMLHRAEGDVVHMLDLANDHWLRNLPPAVATEVNCVRYQPEEVVGAASSEQYPVSFIQAERAAEQLKKAFALRNAGSMC